MDIALQTSMIVTVIVAICESIKQLGVPSRFIPIISVALGLGCAFLSSGFNFLSIASGVILGLSITGGYRLVKTSILNK